MNALDRPTLEELCERLQELGGDAEVGVVVLTGSGEKAFVAGADIKYMSGLSVEEATAWGELGHRCTQLLETMRQPTIAAIQGFLPIDGDDGHAVFTRNVDQTGILPLRKSTISEVGAPGVKTAATPWR